MTVHLTVLQPLSREQLRSRRHREVRSTTISVRHMTKREREFLRLVVPEADRPYWRPQTRQDCIDGPRPCPYVACQWNLYLDVTDKGSVKLNFPDLEPHEMAHSCALDIVDKGPATLERVAEVMNVVRERVRQIETRARKKLEKTIKKKGIELR